MKRVVLSILAGAALASGAAAVEPSDQATQPKCVTAEINPVTGHVFCLEPLGAPVEPPSPEAALPCKPEDSRGQWAWAPNCAPEPGDM